MKQRYTRQYSNPDRQEYIKGRSSASAHYKLYYHIVWATKYRRKIIGEKLSQLLIEEFQAICERNGYVLLSVALAVDHVHVLASLKPNHEISKVVHHLKGASSHTAFHRYPDLKNRIGEHLWSQGYSVETLGEKSVAQIKAYLDKQEDKHFWDVEPFGDAADQTTKARAKRGSWENVQRVLAKVPDVEPEECDRL